ncbi:hypothetical protein FA15DRAFT_760289 [Coprinopsis marcescibilis]|uniref:Uncharacterized protein n=1 Tax=Coprinopsis marcescibilis TaxID=230819 RepID=A0A5C3KG16_COPMA|nr:hypothetical protein FA15DRAFT_760289 [Coprinopsis marcescibilis]
MSQLAWAETAGQLASRELEDIDSLSAREFEDQLLESREFLELEGRAPILPFIGLIAGAIAKAKARARENKQKDIANGFRSANGKKIQGYKQAKKAWKAKGNKRSFDDDDFTITARSFLDLVDSLEERGLGADDVDVGYLLRRSFEDLSDLD